MRLFLALLLAGLAVPLQAGETPWQEVAPGVRLRIISTGEVKPDGKTLAALEIDMPEGTKTYWRVPGETGLPLDLDDAGSTGLVGQEVLWPYPTVDQSGGYLDYVYFGHTVLPLLVATTGGAPQLETKVTLGVCSDICMPAQAHFSLPLVDAIPDRPNGLRIRQALADVPMTWPGDRPLLGGAALVPDGVTVVIEGEGLDPSSLIATVDDGTSLLGPPQIGPEPEIIRFPVVDADAAADLGGREVTFTFMTEDGAFETSRTVESPAEAPQPE